MGLSLDVSALAGSPLLDASGERLGRVDDVIVSLGTGDTYPPVTGLKARIGGREVFVSADQIAEMEPAAVKLRSTKLNLGQFERRPGEVLLRCDVLGRSLINVETARLVKAQEVKLECRDGRWYAVGIDSTFHARLRRLLPRSRRANRSEETVSVLDWRSMEPFVGHVPTARLRLAPRRIARLHPAQIADLVEAASHDEGEEIMEAVRQDRELEADVFEELDDEHQLEFLQERSDEQVAAVLARMASDDAADLLTEIDQDRRLPVLERMPPQKQKKIKQLLGFNPSTAGGLMNTDFICLEEHLSVGEALTRVRVSDIGPIALVDVYTSDASGALSGVCGLVSMVKADPADRLSAIAGAVRSVNPSADLPEIARAMTDYNLLTLPVVDEHAAMIGIVTVDDVLEGTLPADWRRRFGVARG